MAIFAFGLNHKTAPVALRERISVVPEHIEQQLRTLIELPAVNEATLVSTCNRTEVYCDVDGDQEVALNWFLNQYELQADNHLQYIYQYFDENSIRHLLRVASGLDSMVVGEPQILGQLKSAYQTAETAGATGSSLHKLFQYAFSVAKEVRTTTGIGANPVSVAYAGVKLASELFDRFDNKKALLVGAGETIELCAQHLIRHNIREMVIANRNMTRSIKLADRFNQDDIKAHCVPLNMLHEQLAHCDIVISSTASQLPLIGKGMVESALKSRKHKPLFLLDLAVPRDIEPEVNQLGDAYLYNLDDLQEFINQNLESRREAADKAELIIDQKVTEFMLWQQGQAAISTIRQYRDWAEQEQQLLINRADSLLQQGKSSQDVIKQLLEMQKNKLLHMPTLLMRHLAEHNQMKSLLYVEDTLQKDNNRNADENLLKPSKPNQE